MSDPGSTAAPQRAKKLFQVRAAITALGCAICASAILFMSPETSSATLPVLAALCVWLATIATAHLVASFGTPSHLESSLLQPQQWPDPASEKIIETKKDGDAVAYSGVLLVQFIGILLVAITLVVFVGLGWRPPLVLSPAVLLVAATIAGLILLLNLSYNGSNCLALWSATLRICSMVSFFVLAISFAWLWFLRTFGATEPHWVGTFSAIVLSALVIDSLLSEFFRTLGEPWRRFESWGPGAGLWMMLFMSEKEASCLEFSQKDNQSFIGFLCLYVFCKARRWFIPVTGLGALFFWLSTAVTVIPSGHVGVQEIAGKTSPDLLTPGLHTHLPMPLVKTTLVNVSGIFELGRGSGVELGRHVLWDERDPQTEVLSLTSSGDELLTANLTVFFKIKDAKAFHKSGDSAREILSAIIQHAWTSEASSAEGWRLLGEQRADITKLIHKKIQPLCDSLGLGIELLFVGMHDIRPPVQTASAFHEVSGTLEIIRTEKAQAEADAALLLAQSRSEAHNKLMLAETKKKRTITAAQTVALPFESLVKNSGDSLGAVRAIKQFSTIERSLSHRPLAIISSSLREVLDFNIDSRELNPKTTPSNLSKADSSDQDFFQLLAPRQESQSLNIDPLPRAEPGWEEKVDINNKKLLQTETKK